jgi:hypothetical protein
MGSASAAVAGRMSIETKGSPHGLSLEGSLYTLPPAGRAVLPAEMRSDGVLSSAVRATPPIRRTRRTRLRPACQRTTDRFQRRLDTRDCHRNLSRPLSAHLFRRLAHRLVVRGARSCPCWWPSRASPRRFISDDAGEAAGGARASQPEAQVRRNAGSHTLGHAARSGDLFEYTSTAAPGKMGPTLKGRQTP